MAQGKIKYFKNEYVLNKAMIAKIVIIIIL